MKNYIYSLFFLLSFFFCLYSQIPQTLSYQGVLKDVSGTPVPNGTYQLTFRIYQEEMGGTPIWNEVQMLPVSEGVFNAILGAFTPLNLPFDELYWLGVTIGTGTELPRIRFTSSAYSLNARTVEDTAITTAKIADEAVTQAKLAPGLSLPPGGAAGGDLTGTYPNPVIAESAVNSAKIQDGTIQLSDLNFTPLSRPLSPGVASAEIADNAVTTPKLADGAVTQAKLDPGLSLPPGGTAGGDLQGSYPNPTVDGLLGRDISSTPPGSGQILKWDGNYWSPADDDTAETVWKTSGTNIYSTNSGNVGIGMTNPARKLDVAGHIGVPENGRYFLSNEPALWWNWRTANIAIGSPGPRDLEFYAGSELPGLEYPRMRLNSTTGQLTVSGPLYLRNHRRVASTFMADSLDHNSTAIYAAFIGSGPYYATGIRAYSQPSIGYGVGGIFQGGAAAALMWGNFFIDGTYDSFFYPEQAGNLSVRLPDDAISSPEISNEPGIASQLNSSEIYLTTVFTMQDLETVSITLPAAGYVVINAKCYIEFNGSTSAMGAAIQIDQNIGGSLLYPYYQYIYADAFPTAFAYYYPVSLQRTYYFSSAGEQVFRLEGTKLTSNGTARSWDHILTAVYYPTSYGPVMAMTDNPEGNPEARFISSNRPADRNEYNSAYEIDLRYYELQVARARAEFEAAEKELYEAKLKLIKNDN